jgi:integrase/recombinase XerC
MGGKDDKGLFMLSESLLLYKKKWLVYLTSVRRLAVNSTNAYHDDFASCTSFFATYYGAALTLDHFKTMTVSDIRAWAAERQKQTFNVRSTARVLVAMKNFTRFLIQENVCEDHVLLSFRLGRIAKKLPRPLTHGQALDMVDNIDSLAKQSWLGARDQALLALLYGAGLRISEALALTTDSIKRDFLVVLGKVNKVRHVPLMAHVKASIDAYLALSPYAGTGVGEHDYLFRGARGGQMSPSIAQQRFREYR